VDGTSEDGDIHPAKDSSQPSAKSLMIRLTPEKKSFCGPIHSIKEERGQQSTANCGRGRISGRGNGQDGEGADNHTSTAHQCKHGGRGSVVPMEITFMDNDGNIFILYEFLDYMNSYII
jgi:hypothetical protein